MSDKKFILKSNITGQEITFQGDYEVSDGYHTMHELYQHRMALNIALFHSLDAMAPLVGAFAHMPAVYKAKNHHPTSDPMFDGYFIVFAVDRDCKWTSYHYKLEHWDKFKIRIAEFSPPYPIDHVPAVEFFSKLCWRYE